MKGGARVKFDFEGSLQLARSLWALAAELETSDAGRNTEYETAKAKWQGTYGTEFASRRETERSACTNVVNGLRRDAKAWAKAWAKAMEQQNKNNRAAKVEKLRKERSNMEKFGDYFVGDDSDDHVPDVKAVAVPTAPGFLATATEKKF